MDAVADQHLLQYLLTQNLHLQGADLMFDELIINDEQVHLVQSPTFTQTGNCTHVMNSDDSVAQVKCARYNDNDFGAWLNRFTLTQDATMTFRISNETLTLFFILNEDVECTIEGLHEGVLPKDNFNLIYTRPLQVKCQMKGGREYIFFGLNLTVPYLENLDQLSGLPEFLDYVRNGTPALLGKVGYYVVNEAKAIVSDIVAEMSKGVPCQKMHMRTQFHALVEKSLGQADSVRSKEMILFNQVNNHIFDNLSTVTVVSIEEKFHMSPLYFRTLVRKQVNMKPVSYIIDCRMRRGMLLLSQGFSLLEIARHVGYSGQSAFSKAFLKKIRKVAD